jgi:cobyrinic acid a,c-diamide synthase
MKRIIIGGTKSGCGKTTVTCALLAALKRRNINVSAFKCGPDYIDPMFHRKVIGVESHNLDSFFFDRNTILNLLGEYGKKAIFRLLRALWVSMTAHAEVRILYQSLPKLPLLW